jgi:hypothetical protein
MTNKFDQRFQKGAFIPDHATKKELIAKYWELHTRLYGLRNYLENNKVDVDAVEARALELREHEFDEDWLPEPFPLNESTKRRLDGSSNRARLQYLLEYHMGEALQLLQDHDYITWEEAEQLGGDATVLVVI